MDFGLTDEQRMLQESVRSVMKREVPISLVRHMDEANAWHDPHLWDVMAKSGWLALGLPKEYGGEDGDSIGQALLCSEAGRAQAPSLTTYLSTIVPCAWLIAVAGTVEQKQRYLPAVTSGKRRLALAIAEPGRTVEPGSVQLAAHHQAKGYLLSGTKVSVYGGDGAETFLWVARQPERDAGAALGVFLVDANVPGVLARPIPTMTPEGQVEVELRNVYVPGDALLGGVGDITPDLSQVLDRAALLRCAAAEGTARAAFEMTVEYAKRRVQFDKPIGSFQAVQHRLANACFDLEAAWGVLWEAVWSLDQPGDHRLIREVAKASVIQAMERVGEEAHVVHGGIGFLRQYDLHLRTKRMLSATPYIGTVSDSREALAKAMGL